QGNTAVLQRSVGLDTARGSVSATWRTDALFGPGIAFSPFAEVRGDVFRNETTPGHYEAFTRGLAMGGTEISWPVMRAGEHGAVMVEPVVMAAYANDPGADPRIVNEDALGFELDDSNLFRPNSVPNYDLWEPGGRVSAGIRATARAATGQSASFMFGRQ